MVIKIEDLTEDAGSIVRHQGLLEERVKLLRRSRATNGDLSAVCEALSAVAADQLGRPCRVVLKVGSVK